MVIFKADDDVRINEIRWNAHLSVPFSGRVLRKGRIEVARIQIVLADPSKALVYRMGEH
jgi:hypothetical protein